MQGQGHCEGQNKIESVGNGQCQGNGKEQGLDKGESQVNFKAKCKVGMNVIIKF